MAYVHLRDYHVKLYISLNRPMQRTRLNLDDTRRKIMKRIDKNVERAVIFEILREDAKYIPVFKCVDELRGSRWVR
jgi:hypothetical protein